MRLFKKFTQTFCKVQSKRFSRTHCSQLAQRAFCAYTLLGISTNKCFARTHILSLKVREYSTPHFFPLSYTLSYTLYILYLTAPLYPYTLLYLIYSLILYSLQLLYTPFIHRHLSPFLCSILVAQRMAEIRRWAGSKPIV